MATEGASASVCNRIAGQASPVSIGIADQAIGRSREKAAMPSARAGKISEAGFLREEIFIPYGFSGRVSQKHRKIRKNPLKVEDF